MDAQARIFGRLDTIENENQISILYACESGSRAWGFASMDSDYDVRFIYVRPREWYLSIDLETRRDVVETPVDETWDINGWDLRKALQLYRKTNSQLYQWLFSPIVYLEKTSLAQTLRDLSQEFYNFTSAAYYYRSMAKRNFREYLRADVVPYKKYLYVVRPLMAARWIGPPDRRKKEGALPRAPPVIEGMAHPELLPPVDAQRPRTLTPPRRPARIRVHGPTAR